MQSNTKRMALSGMLAAVAVVIMCLGGFIPIATYVCPMLACLTQLVVLKFCGKRLAWTWFAAVSLLSAVLSPDKEAAMVFTAIGYYPLIKFTMEKYRLSILLKFLFFNSSVLVAYGIMIQLLGMQQVAAENMELGIAGLIIILLLGNITFLMLDKLLTILGRKLR